MQEEPFHPSVRTMKDSSHSIRPDAAVSTLPRTVNTQSFRHNLRSSVATSRLSTSYKLNVFLPPQACLVFPMQLQAHIFSGTRTLAMASVLPQ